MSSRARMRSIDLSRAMAHRGMVPADADPVPFGGAGRPWYVSAVLGAAGWLASLFGFMFVVLWVSPDTAAGFAFAGALMLGAGYGLYVADRDNAFFEQLALALTLAGEIALVWAVGDTTDSATATAGFATLLSAGLVLALPDHFARMLSTFFACVTWALTVRFGWWGAESLRDPETAVALGPALLGWMLIWIPVAVGVHLLIQREARWMATGARRVARPALTGLLLALSVGTWASEPVAALTVWVGPAERVTSWLALWPLLGVAAALFAAVCAYRLRHEAMLGVAIAGALLHVIQFYYMLGVTLVVKSYVMLAVGAALLVAARGMGQGAASDVAAPSGQPFPGAREPRSHPPRGGGS